MDYNLSREEAAKILWISTRTLDRWIRKGNLSHYKNWNKVYLSEYEVNNFSKNKQVNDVVFDTKTSSNIISSPKNISINTNEIIEKLWNHLDETMQKFLNVIIEKDKKIDEKNQIILNLQQKTFSLEEKLKNTVALPLYQEEKQEILIEKENLKIEKTIIEEKFNKEKITNIFLIWIILILIIVIILI